MTKVMAKCVGSTLPNWFIRGELYEVKWHDEFRVHVLDREGVICQTTWDDECVEFELVETDHPPTTIEEMLAVVEAAGADTAVAATQALHAAGYHK